MSRKCSDLHISALSPSSVAVGKPATVLIHGTAFLPLDAVLYVSQGATWTVNSDSEIELVLADEDTASARELELKVHGADSCISNSVYLAVK
jgi:hypothetical protein